MNKFVYQLSITIPTLFFDLNVFALFINFNNNHYNTVRRHHTNHPRRPYMFRLLVYGIGLFTIPSSDYINNKVYVYETSTIFIPY